MFLAYFHAPGKSQQWPFYENTINPNKAFFTFNLISISFSRHDLEAVPKDSHVASKSVLFKVIFKLMQQPGESKKYARLMIH